MRWLFTSCATEMNPERGAPLSASCTRIEVASGAASCIVDSSVDFIFQRYPRCSRGSLHDPARHLILYIEIGELLAQMIGVQRNAVSLVAHTLQQAGVISYSRGHIEINDLEGLAQTSCECYRVVKSQRDRLLNTADSRFNSND